jgi:hypothetical protein
MHLKFLNVTFTLTRDITNFYSCLYLDYFFNLPPAASFILVAELSKSLAKFIAAFLAALLLALSCRIFYASANVLASLSALHFFSCAVILLAILSKI